MSVRVMINKGSLLHISKDREILIQEENFAYLLPCDKLKNIISNFTITFPNRTIISDDYTIMPHGSVTFQLLNEKSNSLASICEKLGYYDVSHFVKDFKLVCNITPQQYRTNMSDFYNEIAKF